MKILTIVLALFLIVAVASPSYADDRPANTAVAAEQSGGGFFGFLDSVASAIGNAINKIADIFRPKKEEREKEQQITKEEMIQPTEKLITEQQIPQVTEQQRTEQQKAELQRAEVKRIDQQAIELQRSGNPMEGQRDMQMPMEQPVIQQAPVVIQQVPSVPPPAPLQGKRDVLGYSKVEIAQPQVEKTVEIKPAESSGGAVVQTGEMLGTAQTVDQPLILNAGTRNAGTGGTIVQSGTFVGTAQTVARAPLQLSGSTAGTVTETRVGETRTGDVRTDNRTITTAGTAETRATDSRTTETRTSEDKVEECPDVTAFMPEGINTLTTVSASYILALKKNARYEVMSICGKGRAECADETVRGSTDRIIDDVGCAAARVSEPASEVRSAMADICNRKKELLPPPSASRGTGAVAAVLDHAAYMQFVGDKFVYALGNNVRTASAKQDETFIDIIAFNAEDAIKLNLSAFCPLRAGVTDCSETFEFDVTALDRNNVDVSGRIEGTGRNRTINDSKCDLDEGLAVNVRGRGGEADISKSLDIGSREGTVVGAEDVQKLEEEQKAVSTEPNIETAVPVVGGASVQDVQKDIETQDVLDTPTGPEGTSISGGGCSLIR